LVFVRCVESGTFPNNYPNARDMPGRFLSSWTDSFRLLSLLVQLFFYPKLKLGISFSGRRPPIPFVRVFSRPSWESLDGLLAPSFTHNFFSAYYEPLPYGLLTTSLFATTLTDARSPVTRFPGARTFTSFLCAWAERVSHSEAPHNSDRFANCGRQVSCFSCRWVPPTPGQILFLLVYPPSPRSTSDFWTP